LAAAHVRAGARLARGGRLDEAIIHFERAVETEPGLARAHGNLAAAYRRRRRFAEAFAAGRRAVELDPLSASAHNNLALVLKVTGRLDEASVLFERAIELQPHMAEARANLAGIWVLVGRVDEGLAQYAAALEIAPDLLPARSGMLYAMHCVDEGDGRAVFEAHREFGVRLETAVGARLRTRSAGSRAPGRRLRVGYLSPDFRTHSVSWFIEPVLRAHDRGLFEVVGYSDAAAKDHVTDRMRGLCDAWRDLSGECDENVAAVVARDGVDILVDLAGHTTGNRLGVFARRPAPVSVTWLGYPDTTGLTAIDYRLTDAWTDPDGAEERCSESLWRLGGGFLCYGPPEDGCSAPVGPPPSLRSGRVTFGSFNALCKLTAAHIALWSRILLAVPGARLLLKSATLGLEGARERTRAAFLAHGVDPTRLDLRPRTEGLREHFQTYGLVDIALDTFPYHGTTTTMEALWMGVPVVTLAGRTHCQRVGVGILEHVGLKELVASSAAEYEGAAVGLARDPERLGALRRGLRERVKASPLTDAAAFTASLEEAYRSMWRSVAEKKEGNRHESAQASAK
jgi:protein O-GlcNAc transferase